MNINTTLSTDGTGLWSDVAKKVRVTKAELIRFDDKFGELRVFFDPRSWNVNRDGLIYTDPQFLNELQGVLSKHFGSAAAGDVDYSEQGMQGNDYVSLDVGETFIGAWGD